MSNVSAWLGLKNQDAIKQNSLDFEKQYASATAPEEAGLNADSFIPNKDIEMDAAGWKQGIIPFGPGGTPSKLGRAEKLSDEWRQLEKEFRQGFGKGGRAATAGQEKKITDKISRLQQREAELRVKGIYEESPELIERARGMGMKDEEIQDTITAKIGNSVDELEEYLNAAQEWLKWKGK